MIPYLSGSHRVQLYPYQQKYLASMPRSGVMYADVGTGKTLMALAHCQHHAPRATILVVAPASKVREGGWIDDAKRFGGQLPLVISYEHLANHLQDFLGISWALVLDEAHYIKQPTSKRAKAVQALAKQASLVLALSATPLPNGWLDAAGYAVVFGYCKNKTEFWRRHVITQTYKGFPEVAGYRDEPALQAWWDSLSRRLTRAQATQLPPRQFLPLKAKKPALYTKIAKERIMPDGSFIDSAPALLHTLRQTLTPGKLPALVELLERTQENVVVFYNYKSEFEAIEQVIPKNKFVFIQNGQRHEIPPKDVWPSLGNTVTLAHYKSGGTGVEMTYATITVYFSPTYSYAEYHQSLGRTHRNGQKSRTLYYLMNTPGTIESTVWRTLQSKQSFTEKLQQDLANGAL